MLHEEHILDPTGLGRWCGSKFWGKANTFLSIISASSVCTGSISTSPVGGGAFSREYEHIKRSQNLTAPRPRKIMITDLISAIVHLQQSGHSIILLLDSNAQITGDLDLQRLQQNRNLHDLHQKHPAPSTPSTDVVSAACRIDHMFRCSKFLQAMTCSGSLSYLDGPQSDNRGLFVDADPNTILGQPLTTQNIETPRSRSLKSVNPELVEAYH
jgi:hypothetical protein